MMKKTIIILICLGGILFGEDLTMQKVQKYFNEPNQENFLEAINGLIANTEIGLESNLYLAYIYKNELNKNIKIMQENADSLSPKLKFNLANLLLDLERCEEAVTIYDQLNETTPDWSCPWRHKGEALQKLGNLVEAEKALLKAIETRETHYDAYVMLANVQKDMGNYKDALKTLEIGFTFKGKDIENSDEEVSDLNVRFLYLELLKENNRKEDYDKLKKELVEKYPNDERLN